MFLGHVNQLRSVAWAKNNLWQVCFIPAPPHPFNTWFPAYDNSLNTATINNWHPEGYNQVDAEVPESTTTYGITIGFYDDENDTLLKYFTDWIDQILGTYDLGYTEIMPVKEAARVLVSRRYNSFGLVASESPATKSMLVIPSGALNFTGSNNAALNTYTLNFVVVGSIP